MKKILLALTVLTSAIMSRNLLTQVSQAINAFYLATVEIGVHNKVVTFPTSDFRRTFQPAGSAVNAVGTDGAWGNHQLIVGGQVLGNTFYGRYRTLRLGRPPAVFPWIGRFPTPDLAFLV